jgi:hypothetical protein
MPAESTSHMLPNHIHPPSQSCLSIATQHAHCELLTCNATRVMPAGALTCQVTHHKNVTLSGHTSHMCDPTQSIIMVSLTSPGSVLGRQTRHTSSHMTTSHRSHAPCLAGRTAESMTDMMPEMQTPTSQQPIVHADSHPTSPMTP